MSRVCAEDGCGRTLDPRGRNKTGFCHDHSIRRRIANPEQQARIREAVRLANIARGRHRPVRISKDPVTGSARLLSKLVALYSKTGPSVEAGMAAHLYPGVRA